MNDVLGKEIAIDQTTSTEVTTPEFVAAQAQAIIEAGIYLSGKKGISIVNLKRMTKHLELNADAIREQIKLLNQKYFNDPAKGLLIKQFGDDYKMITKPELKPFLSHIYKLNYANPLKHSYFETLAIIAYNQPCTKAKIEEIRAVDSANILTRLIELGLVVQGERQESPGRPFLYHVSALFYDAFGIKSVSELPKINVNFADFTDEKPDFFDINRFED